MIGQKSLISHSDNNYLIKSKLKI